MKLKSEQVMSPLKRLEVALSDTSDVYVMAGVDPAAYFAGLAKDVRESMCEPFPVVAKVMPPGFPARDFPGLEVGSIVSGVCVAHSDRGYWLVYALEHDTFLCFWGSDASNLGAHGVYGSPLGCWSA